MAGIKRVHWAVVEGHWRHNTIPYIVLSASGEGNGMSLITTVEEYSCNDVVTVNVAVSYGICICYSKCGIC